MTKQVRWLCPNDKHAGKLAPSRPRKDDIRRYCLDCSVATGRLTERISPALQKKREVNKVKSVIKRQTKAEKAREKYMIAGIDCDKYMRKLAKLPVFRAYGFNRKSGHPIPALFIHRSKHGYKTKLGHADWWANEIHLFTNPHWNDATIRDVLLHELMHFAERPVREYGNSKRTIHTKAFYRKLKTAWAQAERKFGKPAEAHAVVPKWLAQKGKGDRSHWDAAPHSHYERTVSL